MPSPSSMITFFGCPSSIARATAATLSGPLCALTNAAVPRLAAATAAPTSAARGVILRVMKFSCGEKGRAVFIRPGPLIG